MWLCTANMLIKLEFVWLPSTPEGQLLWTTQVAVQMSCPSWSKRMESRKQIQNDPNAPNATVSYSNSRPHWEDIGFAFWHVVAGPLRQIRTTLPTYTPILLKTLIRTWPSKGLCLPRPPPLTFLSDSGNGSRSQWTTATNCWKAPLAAPVLPASFKRPRALCAPYGSVVLPRPLGRCSPELLQMVVFWIRKLNKAKGVCDFWYGVQHGFVHLFLNDMASFHGFVMICLFAFLGKQQSNAN